MSPGCSCHLQSCKNDRILQGVLWNQTKIKPSVYTKKIWIHNFWRPFTYRYCSTKLIRLTREKWWHRLKSVITVTKGQYRSERQINVPTLIFLEALVSTQSSINRLHEYNVLMYIHICIMLLYIVYCILTAMPLSV